MEKGEKITKEMELTDTDTESAILEVLSKLDPTLAPPLEALILFARTTSAPRLVRWLVHYFSERIRAGLPYDVGMLELFVMHPFEQISDGKNADQAFGLKPMKGKYSREDTFERDIRIAVLVVDKRRKGLTWEDAVGDVAEAMGVNARTVERAYDRFRAGVDDLPAEMLDEMAAEILPTP